MLRPGTKALASLLLFCATLLFCGGASAQDANKINLQVKIMYANGKSVHNHSHVDLLTGGQILITQQFTDDNGNVEFDQLPPGNYRIRVSEPDVEENMSDVMTLARREANSIQIVTVKLKAEAEVIEKQQDAKAALISTLELNVPGGARKEFERGAAALADEKLPEAQKHFERAIELYPQYAMAYNHLGVVYMLSAQPDKGRAAFEKAVALNDRYPSALVNLAKLRYQDGKMQDVEVLLRKAVSGDPSNPEALFILCSAELHNGHLDDALGNAMKLHSLPHAQYVGVHYLTAQALEAKNRTREAIAQYTLFLQEAPTAPASTRAKLALGRLHAQSVPQPVTQPVSQP